MIGIPPSIFDSQEPAFCSSLVSISRQSHLHSKIAFQSHRWILRSGQGRGIYLEQEFYAFLLNAFARVSTMIAASPSIQSASST
jgi:hypothetical protein